MTFRPVSLTVSLRSSDVIAVPEDATLEVVSGGPDKYGDCASLVALNGSGDSGWIEHIERDDCDISFVCLNASLTLGWLRVRHFGGRTEEILASSHRTICTTSCTSHPPIQFGSGYVMIQVVVVFIPCHVIPLDQVLDPLLEVRDIRAEVLHQRRECGSLEGLIHYFLPGFHDANDGGIDGRLTVLIDCVINLLRLLHLQGKV